MNDHKTKHTPGPWQWYRYGKSKNSPVKVETAEKVVAEIIWCGHGNHATRIANARLIAAAPDLLEALRAVLRDCNLRELGHGGRMDQAIAASRAAIAKADGGEA
jgi:hypothetical protein